MKTSLPCVAVMARNTINGIGLNGIIPWQCKLDMKVFRTVSKNSFMIMGRKTLESFPVVLTSLNRFNICITRKKGLELDVLQKKYQNVLFTDNTNIDEIESMAHKFFDQPYVDKISIIGGMEILELFKKDISVLFLSQIKDRSACDRHLDNPSEYGDLLLLQSPLFLEPTNYEKLEIYLKTMPKSFKDGIMAAGIINEIIIELKKLLDTWHFKEEN